MLGDVLRGVNVDGVHFLFSPADPETNKPAGTRTVRPPAPAMARGLRS